MYVWDCMGFYFLPLDLHMISFSSLHMIKQLLPAVLSISIISRRTFFTFFNRSSEILTSFESA